MLTDGHTPDFDFVGGAMAEVVKSTARLTDEDRRAIAVYLKSLARHPFAKEAWMNRGFRHWTRLRDFL